MTDITRYIKVRMRLALAANLFLKTVPVLSIFPVLSSVPALAPVLVPGMARTSGNTLSRMAAPLLAAALLLIAVYQTAWAQIPAAPQSGPVALTGGTIHTVSGPVIENGTLVFDQGKIIVIGKDVAIPDDARVVPVEGKHIFPGLIDAWSQMGIYEIGAVPMTLDIVEQGRFNPNVRVEVAVNPESRHIGVARSAGVLTTVTTPGGGLIAGQSAALALDGWSWEDMTLRPGVSLIINWPSPSDRKAYEESVSELTQFFEDARAYHKARQAAESSRGKAAAQQEERERSRWRRSSTQAESQQTIPRHDFDSRFEAMAPYLSGSRPVTIHANEVRQIQDAASWARAQGLRPVIMGGRDAHRVSRQLHAMEIPVIITTVLASPVRSYEPYDIRYRLPVLLHDAGVTFAIAGSSSAAYANRLPWEAGAAAAFGLPLEEALRAVTRNPAIILGLDDQIGALETGMDATFVITDGHPLEYTTQILQVYIRGRKSDMNDVHRQLYDKYRRRLE